MTSVEWSELWRAYPEVGQLFLEFNDICQEDDASWVRVINRCREIETQYQGSESIEIVLADVLRQLENISRKKGGG